MDLIVDRAELGVKSFIDDRDGRCLRCIIGHFLRALAIGDDRLETYGSLADAVNDGSLPSADLPEEADWLLVHDDECDLWSDSGDFDTITAINDSELREPEEKEQALIELFALHRVNLKFIGNYPEGDRTW